MRLFAFSLEFYRGQQINLKTAELTLRLEPLYTKGDPRAAVQPEDNEEEEEQEEGGLESVGVQEVDEEQGEEGGEEDLVTAGDFQRMVALLPRSEQPEANFSMHAHSHVTVYALPNAAALRDLTARFPEVVTDVAVFARRQQHARLRLQWQDVGSSIVWLRNEEMKRLLFSISKVGMAFAMQRKKMDNVLKTLRDAKTRAALEQHELNAECRPGVGGQVEGVMRAVPALLTCFTSC